MVKIAALLSGVLASVIGWAASYFLVHLDAEFLSLWAPSNSQQLFGLVTWHAIVGLGLAGGVVTVLSPLAGGLILLLAAGGWAGLGLVLPSGFGAQVIGPLVVSLLGAVAAFGALLRGMARKRVAGRPSLEDMAREEALRLEPRDELARAVEMRNERSVAEPDESASPSSEPISVERREPEQAGPPRGMSGLFVANVAVLLVLTGAVSLLVYSGLRSGQLAATFSSAPAAPILGIPSAAPTGVPPAPETAAANDLAATPPAQAADAEARVGTEPELQAASMPATAAVPAADEWTDPFAYCAAVKTVDFPDRRYAGPNLTTEIAEALRVPRTSSPDRAKWRCYEGAVLGCASFDGPRCALTPTVTEMLEFCARNPNATGLLAPSGTWSCKDTNPEVPAGESWPMDARGFLPGAWIEITPTAAPSAG